NAPHFRVPGDPMRTICTIAASALLLTAVVSAQQPTIRLHAARVVDGAGKVIPNATVVVQGSKITGIETSRGGRATYERGSLTLMPGMIDVHAHVGWHFGPDGRLQERDPDP